MITATQIDRAKARTAYSGDPSHGDDDRIRIAYEWLDAQNKGRGPTKRTLALRHLIQIWSGRAISISDVEVAATLHPDIRGDYPNYNFLSPLMLPTDRRLMNIEEPGTHLREAFDPRHYAGKEALAIRTRFPGYRDALPAAGTRIYQSPKSLVPFLFFRCWKRRRTKRHGPIRF